MSGEEGAEALTVIEGALRKRLDDWMASTSEFYARQSGDDDRWRAGLVGYLMRGPGALDTAVLALLDERDALRAQVERVRAVLAAPGWHPRHAADEGCHICMFHGQLRTALDPE